MKDLSEKEIDGLVGVVLNEMTIEADYKSYPIMIREKGDGESFIANTGESSKVASRIVACWNICKGLDTEDLESMMSKGKTYQDTISKLSTGLEHAQRENTFLDVVKKVKDMPVDEVLPTKKPLTFSEGEYIPFQAYNRVGRGRKVVEIPSLKYIRDILQRRKQSEKIKTNKRSTDY